MKVIRLAPFLFVSAALATDLNLTIQSAGFGSISVQPGQWVGYQVIGQLSDMDNDGLALFAFDLEFSGGALPQADDPTGPPMDHFAIDKGISNPAGFGGTPIDGRLVQVGGGQNTIKNTIEYAPYPIGEVITDVGHKAVVLASGSLAAPLKPGNYVLSASNVVANVIKPNQLPEGEFWEVVAAGQGTLTALSIEVTDTVVAIVSSVPPNNAIDARQPSAVDGSNPGGWNQLVITFSGSLGTLTPWDFSVASTMGTAPVITEVQVNGQDATLLLNAFVPAGAWTTFTHHGSNTSVRVGFLPADVNADRTSSPLDILALIDGLNGVVTLEPWQSDINRSGQVEPSDILAVIDLLNGAGVHEAWNGRELPK
jgi:hypothetical protein